MEETGAEADAGGAAPAEGAPAAGGRGGFRFGLGSVLPLLLGLVGFAVAYHVLSFGNDDFVTAADLTGCGNAAPVAFASTPQYRLWVFLICAQTGIWLALAAPLIASLLRAEMRPRLLTRDVWPKAAALGLFLLWLFLFSPLHKAPFANLHEIHPHHGDKLDVFNVVGGLVAGLAIVGLWVTQAALKEEEGRGDARRVRERVGVFLALRSGLELYLLAAGVIIGAATLATGALRQAIIAVCPAANKQFMVQDVLGYGLAFSFLLALVYAPAYAQLVRARSALHDWLVELPQERPKVEERFWDVWNAERKAVSELLHANAGLFASLAGTVSILTPLLGSLVSLLLGKGE